MQADSLSCVYLNFLAARQAFQRAAGREAVFWPVVWQPEEETVIMSF